MGSALTWKLAALLTLQFLSSTKNIVHIFFIIKELLCRDKDSGLLQMN
jgi:hypothetical protein